MRTSTLLSLLVAAILGLAAVFGTRAWLAEQRAEIAASSNAPAQNQNTIVVAKEPLRFGDRVSPDRLEVITWASATLPNGAFRTIEEIGDNSEEKARFVLSSIEMGEPVLASRITDPGQRAKLSTAIKPGLKAMSIRVNDVAGVAGFVLPGDRVDVLLTRAEVNNDEDAYVDVLLQGVRVLAIDQIADDRKDQPSVVRTVTFEVSTEEAQKLTLGSSVGTLSLALRNVVSSDTENSQRVTLAEMSQSATASDLEAELALRAEAERQAAVARQQEQDSRIASLEEMVRSMGGDVGAQLDALKDEIAKAGTPVVLPAPEPTPQPVVEVPPEPTKPAFVTVGVVRNGKREDYVVTSNEN